MKREVAKTARNERRKLQATSVNAIGLTALGFGLLQPFLRAEFGARELAIGLLSAIMALGLHVVALHFLRDLED